MTTPPSPVNSLIAKACETCVPSLLLFPSTHEFTVYFIFFLGTVGGGASDGASDEARRVASRACVHGRDEGHAGLCRQAEGERGSGARENITISLACVVQVKHEWLG